MPKHEPEKKQHSEPAAEPKAERKHHFSTLKTNAKFWIYATAAISLILVIVLATGFSPMAGTAGFKSANECASDTIAFLNKNLVQPGTSATLKSVEDVGGVYMVTTNYQNASIPVYVSKNCEMLFVSAINTTQDTTSQTQEQTQQQAVVKSDKPVLELYVMSFCPYGVQAEQAMKPVVDLLGSKATIKIRFIVGINGNNVTDVDSLHGLQEAKEDLRQVCVMKYYPAKYWSYLMGIDNTCYPLYRDAAAMDACWKNISANLSINATQIETCAYGSEGMTLLKVDEALAGQNQASGSPTIIINGVRYSGARSPDAFKAAICDAFNTAPSECSNALSTNGGTASGDCG